MLAVGCEDDQVRAALCAVKGLLRACTPASDIALVVQDDGAWAPRLQPVAQEYGVLVRYATSEPLAETRVGRWTERVLTTVEDGLTAASLARVLTHPLDAGLDGPAWQRLRCSWTGRAPDWPDVDTGDFDWPGRATRAAWVEGVETLLESRGVVGRATRARDLSALNFLRAELAVLATPPDETLTQAEFIQEVREVLALVVVPSDPGSRGVALLTPSSLVGAAVAHVFVLGAVDGSLPAPLTDDPALDFTERRRLARAGVPVDTAATLARRDAVTFWSLLRAVGEAFTVSWSRLGAGSRARTSPRCDSHPPRPAPRLQSAGSALGGPAAPGDVP